RSTVSASAGTSSCDSSSGRTASPRPRARVRGRSRARPRSMHKRVVFQHRLLPYVLVFPQIAITLVFFVWPAGQALVQSVLLQDAFGLSTQFVGTENFRRLFADPSYEHALRVTMVFVVATV